ncbi:MAG: DUF1772 domain-containing protein [Actinomycetota bacterium]|nr:DUF1772 domain-containing protein [Actinomycetota bacterium]
MNIATTGARPMTALLATARPAAIVLTGVLAGAVLGTWLSEASLGSSTELWIAYHQAITASYTGALPTIGGLGLIAALAALTVSWRVPRDRWLILTAVACLMIGLIVTVVVHFPINAEIATWRPAAPPADWQQLRGRWLTAHAVRTALAVVGFTLLVIAGSRRGRTAALGAEPA